MVKRLSDGTYKFGTMGVMPEYVKGVRGKVNDLHELDVYLSAKIGSGPGVSALDDTFCREMFSPFYADCLTGIQSLEAAISKAGGVSDDFKPNVRVKKQLAIVVPALHALLQSMYTHMQKIKDRSAFTDRLMAEALEPELSSNDKAIIEELRAQEIRAAFRSLPSDEARSLMLQRKLLRDGDLFTLRAVKDDVIGLMPATMLPLLEADYIQAKVPWLFTKKDDDAHLWRQMKTRAQLITGIAFKVMTTGANGQVKLPNVSPWNDGRFFVENGDGFMLRLPLIPEDYDGSYIPDPIYWTRKEAFFSMKMAV